MQGHGSSPAKLRRMSKDVNLMTPIYFRWICIYITEWKLQLKQNKTRKTNKTKDLDNHKNNGTWLGLISLYESPPICDYAFHAYIHSTLSHHMTDLNEDLIEPESSQLFSGITCIPA